MARNITVTFADGSTAEYKNAPDDVTPEQVTERAQKEYGLAVTSLDGGKKGGLMEEVKRFADVAGSAAVRGASSLPALIGDVSNFICNNMPSGLNPFDLGMRAAGNTPEQVEASKVRGMPMSSANTAAGAQPTTTGEKYLASGVEGVAGALAGPGGAVAPLRNALVGAASGVGAQLGGQLTGDSAMGRLAGGVVGGGLAQGVTGLAARVRPQSGDLAREAVEGLSPDTLKAAQAMQVRAKASGVNMDLAQALEAVGAPASNLATIRNVLANSRHGSATQAVLRNQPKELELLADVTVGGLPGPQWGAGQAANAVQEAATKSVQGVKDARGAMVKPLYAKAGALSEEARGTLLKSIDDLMERPGTTDAFNKAATELKRKLSGAEGPEIEAVTAALEKLASAPRGKGKALAAVEVKRATEAARQVQAKPLMAADVDTAISDAVGPFKGTPLSPVDPKSAGQVKGLAGTVNKQLQSLSPEIREAERVFAQQTEEMVNPLKQSVVGRLATPRGYRPDMEASAAKLDSIFSKGSDSQVAEAARDIPKMFNELRKIDKDAAPAAAKAFIRGRLDRSFGSTPGEVIPGAVTSPNAAKVLRDSLFATRAQEQGMKDIAVGIARSYDLPEDDMVRGLSHFMQITKGLASRPDKVGGLNWGDVAKAGGKSSLADVARVYGFMPFERVARKIEDATLAKTFQEFDRVLTTPEGADLLLTLSRTTNMSDKAALAISKFGAVTAASAPEPVEDGAK